MTGQTDKKMVKAAAERSRARRACRQVFDWTFTSPSAGELGP
jgi:RNase P protein component